MRLSTQIRLNITFYLDEDGSISISDTPCEFSDLILILTKSKTEIIRNGKE